MTRSQEIAQTILEQLGGRKLIVMTGAKNFVAHESALQFSLPSNFAKNNINRVLITLTSMDDYTVEFWYIGKHAAMRISIHEGIYCDQLQDIFEEQTGLFTTLMARK